MVELLQDVGHVLEVCIHILVEDNDVVKSQEASFTCELVKKNVQRPMEGLRGNNETKRHGEEAIGARVTSERGIVAVFRGYMYLLVTPIGVEGRKHDGVTE